MPRVLILVFRHGTLDDAKGYTLRYMAHLWQQEGVEVVLQKGPGPIIDAQITRRASRARWGPLLEAGVREHGSVQDAVVADYTHIERRIVVEAVLELDLEAEEVEIEFARLGDIEDAQDGRYSPEFRHGVTIRLDRISPERRYFSSSSRSR